MPQQGTLFASLTKSRRRVAIGAAALLVTGFITYHWVAPELTGEREAVSAPAAEFGTVRVDQAPPPADGGAWSGPAKGRWPAAGSAVITVAAGKPVRADAGAVPVTVKTVPGKAAPGRVRVSTLPEAHSGKLGVSGPVIAVEADRAGDVDASFGYDGFAELFGGGWAGRLGLIRLPACAASTPEKPECQEATPVRGGKSPKDSTVSTKLTLSASAATVLAVSGDTESGEGDYKASDLQASGSWSAGDGSGGFSYTNAVKVPPAQGPTPEIALSYSSQMVDGRTAGRNNQASWAGDGWDYSPGFVERSYVTCLDDLAKVDDKDPNNKEKKTADQCWKGKSPNITVSLGGTNATLVKDDATGAWRPAQDGDWKVEYEGSPATGDAATSERWVVTTPDGTRNYFAGEADAANSRWTLPVFGNHEGEACRADAFKDSSCQQAWRWLLDKQVDVSGNTTRYYYKKETGHYGAAGDKSNRVSFDRGGNLERIEYGLNTAYPDVAATARVVFATADRCFATECYKDDKPVKANWADVPWDKECTAEPCTDKLAPVFFSTRRLTKITTEIRSGSAFSPVESWTLEHEFKAPKAAQSASLWLKQITHAGHVGGTVTDPPVVFTGVELANQVNAIAGAMLFSRWRIDNVRTESGADIHVTYSPPDCDAGDLPAPSTNNRLCYPVYWTPDGYFDPTMDWFRKYVVTEITQSDRTADQPPILTRYRYSTDGGGATVLWGWDDGEFTKKKHRTYGQWRGYAQVTTLVGQTGTGKVLTTRKRFYRGLDDQPLPDDKTRTVQVTDSAGTAYPDHPALAGSTLEEAKLDGDDVVEATATAYWVKKTAERDRTGGSDRAYKIAPSVQRTRKLLAPGTWQRTETRTDYDDEGRPESVSDLGDAGQAGDETCTRTTYLDGAGDLWLRGLVSREEKVARACAESVSRPADIVSDTKTYYDKSETHGTAPTKGRVTRVDTLDDWKNGAPVYTTTERKGYDALGRENSTTDALGKTTTTTYTPAGPGPVTQTRTVNPLGHEVITDQNPAWSEPTSILDANKKRTDLAHDAMGRLAKVWLPGRAKATATPNMEFGYLIRNDGPLAVTTRRLGPNGNYVTEVGLFDSLYRAVQTQEDAPKTTEGKDARLVTSTGYNDRGQTEYESEENYALGKPGNGLLQITPGEDRNRTVSTYDRMGRVVEEALWSHNVEKWATTTAYGGSPAGWQTTLTPPRGGTATATIENVDGDVVEKREFHGATPEGAYDATKYTYTPRGDLATVVKGGFTWKYEYDLRGREVQTTDPEKGITKVEYNNADDVLKSTDAKGDVVSTVYDDLGRQKERYFNAVKSATWTYDTVAKGHPAKSTSIVGGYSFSREVFEYNDAYQVVDEESVIPAMPGLTALAGTYVTTNTYTVNGLLHRTSLPKVGPMEKEGLTRTYDDFGNVVKLAGTSSPSGTVRTYVDRATWSPYGEVLNRWLGTPVGDKPQAYQNYVYDDATRRLSEFYFDRDGTVPNVAALKYGYDDAGNVLSMADRPVDADNNPRAGEEDVQCFGYDHLRRLTQAWSQSSATCAAPGTGTIGGKAPYWKTWSFDQHGSRDEVTDKLTGKVSKYAYWDGTHAVRTVTAGENVEHYDWDERGNLEYRKIGDRTETFAWSPHGKLTKISGPEGDTTMVYDVDGNRIARVDPAGAATVFVYGHEYTTTPTQGTSATRYFEHGGDTVAARTDTTSRKGDIVWLGADQQDSAAWAVNSVSRAATIKYNDPYGNPRDASAAQPQWPAGQRGFVGGVNDPTGLTLLGARFYDPRTGAFISVDPEVDEYDPQRLHPYAYANNNPATFSDPDGLFWGALKNGIQKAASSVASGVTSAAKAVVNNAGTIASVAGTVAMVATFLPPPAQVVAAAAGAVAAVAGAIDTAKSCVSGDALNCAVGVASMVPGVRQAKNAARGASAVKNAAKRLEDACNSFLPGTKVLMADGSHKPIEEIELDDEVRAADPETGADGARPVTRLITGHGDKRLVEISVDVDGDQAADDSVTATDGHPFWVESEQKWLRAGQLRPGMVLLTPDGARVTVIAIVAYGAVATVHNLTVDDLHTYYVQSGEQDVLVHNSGGVCPTKEALAEDALDRAQDIHGALHPRAARARTTSVIHALKPDGTSVKVVSTSGKRNLTRAQKNRMQNNEEAAPSSRLFSRHAEVNGLRHIRRQGYTPLAGAASRNVCFRCARIFSFFGISIRGPVFRGGPRATPYRLFWW
jgi:RHS repeat-associated protein